MYVDTSSKYLHQCGTERLEHACRSLCQASFKRVVILFLCGGGGSGWITRGCSLKVFFFSETLSQTGFFDWDFGCVGVWGSGALHSL